MSPKIQWRMLRPRCKAQQDQVVSIPLLEGTEYCNMASQVGNCVRAWQMLPEVHSMKQMWNDHAKEDGWGILLVDSQNAFNEALEETGSSQ
eukprot:2022386-Ditylum_brightwellii.AAC.1